MNALLVFLGGGLGAVARYGAQGFVYRWAGAEFPFGTMVVNVTGSFVIGLLMTLFEERFMAAPEVRRFLRSAMKAWRCLRGETSSEGH
jgi:CrcB protein